MSLQLYNTLTGKKEEFKPLKDGEVSMYTCGPTVYNYAHIGNLRAYVFADVLRRTLEYNGYAVKQVMNITDVGQLTSDADEGEDKMVKALKREGKPLTLQAMKEVANKYTAVFLDDLKALNIELPHELPKASEHIKEDIELIQTLEHKGCAYKASDGVYFDVSKFPAYGTRGGFKLGELKEGARVAVNVQKRSSRDFALWKFSISDIGWESPWGRGFPGWHIECSVMSRKYLGQPFDIHTGGIDHIPVHHQNEIAQSEAAYGVPLANYWMHNEHLNMGVEKMAKSGENFITLQTLKDRGIYTLAYRYWLLIAHYRTPIEFIFEALKNAQNSYVKLLTEFIKLSPLDKHEPMQQQGNLHQKMSTKMGEAINDDLNTSRLLALLWVTIETSHLTSREKSDLILETDKILGLDIENQSKKLAEEMNAIPEDIRKLSAAREDARRSKDFAKSDELREHIRAAGFEIMDTDSGPIVRKKL
ncbi:MAG TPA: cysteine--tRNA ligase [Candidatus Paceibacterota bacterium]